MPPRFSIITVTYNAVRTLDRTIASVADQSYSEIQYIVVDGGSTDGTFDVIKRTEAFITQWVSEPDRGLYDAMNKGLRMATGDYVWFLNAGDELKHRDIVAELATRATENGMPDILYGETDLINSEGEVLGGRRLKAPDRLTWKSFRRGMLVSHQAFIAKRSVASSYDLRYRFSADFDWCIRCMKQTTSIVNAHTTLVNYLSEGLTTANRSASLKERYAIMCKYYGTFATLLRHVWFAIRFYWAKITKQII